MSEDHKDNKNNPQSQQARVLKSRVSEMPSSAMGALLGGLLAGTMAGMISNKASLARQVVERAQQLYSIDPAPVTAIGGDASTAWSDLSEEQKVPYLDRARKQLANAVTAIGGVSHEESDADDVDIEYELDRARDNLSAWMQDLEMLDKLLTMPHFEPTAIDSMKAIRSTIVLPQLHWALDKYVIAHSAVSLMKQAEQAASSPADPSTPPPQER